MKKVRVLLLTIVLAVTMSVPAAVFAVTGTAGGSTEGSSGNSGSYNYGSGSTGSSYNYGSGSYGNYGSYGDYSGYSSGYGSSYGSDSSVSIVFTDDIHSDLSQIAKAETFFSQQEYQHAAAVFLDAGNYSMGEPYETVYQTSAPELNVIRSASYDAVGTGASELALGQKAYAAMIKKAPVQTSAYTYSYGRAGSTDNGAALIASNMKDGSDLPKSVVSYKIIEKNTRKIAVFSIVSPDAVSAAGGDASEVTDPVKAAEEVMKKIRKQNPQLVICMYSGGAEGTKAQSKLASEVEGIDLIISSGGSRLEKAVKEGNTRIVSAGGSSHIGTVLCTQSDDKLKFSSYKVSALNDSVSADGTVQAAADKYKYIYNSGYFSKYGFTYGQKLAKSEITFQPSEAADSNDPYGNLIASAYLDAARRHGLSADAAIAAQGALNRKDAISSGSVHVSDLYRAFGDGEGSDGAPGKGLVSVYLKGSDLTSLLSQGVKENAGGSQLYFSGVTAVYNKHRLGSSKVYSVKMTADGGSTAIEPEAAYCIVMDRSTASIIEKKYPSAADAFRDKAGKAYGSAVGTAVMRNDTREIKEWSAVAGYLKYIGSNQLNKQYAKAGTAIVYNNSFSPSSMFAESGKSIGIIVSILAIVICLVILLIILLRRRRRGPSFSRGYGRSHAHYPRPKKEKPIFRKKHRF